MENLDIEKFSNIELSKDDVKSISDKCNELKNLHKEIEDKDKEISELKKKAKEYEERTIPDMMQEAGVSKLNVLTANIDKGQDNQVSELVRICEQLGFAYTQKQKVEPMTLKAFVKEQVEKGEQVPFDMFGVYIANKTKITNK